MPVKARRPITPGTRERIDLCYDDITCTTPERSLTRVLHKHSGRDFTGRIRVRHQGGGNKRKYRLIDFKRTKDGMAATVKTIEYDPNRNCGISLVEYGDKELRYILSPLGLMVGDKIESGPEADITLGNCLPIRNIPEGTTVHNVELVPQKGGQIARSAGSFAVISSKEGRFATLKLPSGEERLISIECRATIGQIGNLDVKNISLGKAGRNRHRGIRPSVRGIAMNPCDHPHGGGEGRSPVGRPGPVSPTGKPTLGFKTRGKRKASSKYILVRRK